MPGNRLWISLAAGGGAVVLAVAHTIQFSYKTEQKATPPPKRGCISLGHPTRLPVQPLVQSKWCNDTITLQICLKIVITVLLMVITDSLVVLKLAESVLIDKLGDSVHASPSSPISIHKLRKIKSVIIFKNHYWLVACEVVSSGQSEVSCFNHINCFLSCCRQCNVLAVDNATHDCFLLLQDTAPPFSLKIIIARGRLSVVYVTSPICIRVFDQFAWTFVRVVNFEFGCSSQVPHNSFNCTPCSIFLLGTLNILLDCSLHMISGLVPIVGKDTFDFH